MVQDRTLEAEADRLGRRAAALQTKPHPTAQQRTASLLAWPRPWVAQLAKKNEKDEKDDDFGKKKTKKPPKHLAKKFYTGSPSGNHAEMCVVAGAHTHGKKLVSVTCTHPNCDFCLQMLSDINVTGGSITAGDGGSQLTWCHPFAAALFGTGFGANMQSGAAALAAYNKKGTKPPTSCGTIGYSKPSGELVELKFNT